MMMYYSGSYPIWIENKNNNIDGSGSNINQENVFSSLFMSCLLLFCLLLMNLKKKEKRNQNQIEFFFF